MVFAGAIAHKYPLTTRDRTALQRFQELLSFRDEDIAAIEAPILATKKAEFEQQQAELAQQHEQQARERAEQQRRLEQQELAEKEWQAELQQQREQAQRQAQAQAEQRRQSSSTGRQVPTVGGSGKIQTEPFEFETASLAIVKKPGLFGGKTTVEINRSPGSAEYFTQDLSKNVTLDMVAIPGGRFQMGSNENDDEKPIHSVTVESFFIGKYPVTQAQYEAIMGNNPAHFKGAQRPVEQVSWDKAVEFCDRLSQKTGKSYRLPSEAEWEYACRAGTTTPFSFGETITTDLVNYDGNYPYGEAPKGTYRKETTDVGSFPANTFGLYDMHGNVWEWCLDRWHENYQGAPIDGSAWLTENDNRYQNESRLLRRGSWDGNPRYCRSAFRVRDRRDLQFDYIGCRVVCAVSRIL
jgi:formylglycine-generating enzyme required for sulfatase activity